jgi:hypothetical protein
MRREVLWRGGTVLLLALGACGVQAERHAQVRNDDDVPFGLLNESEPPLLPPSAGVASPGVPLCFIREDELTVVPTGLRTPSDLAEVVEALAEPPADLRSAFGEDRLVSDVTLDAGVAHVDLLPAVAALGGDEQLLAVAQLVCTLTGQPGVGPVAFTLDGASVDVPRGDGSLTSEPVSRDDYSDLLDGEGR